MRCCLDVVWLDLDLDLKGELDAVNIFHHRNIICSNPVNGNYFVGLNKKNDTFEMINPRNQTLNYRGYNFIIMMYKQTFNPGATLARTMLPMRYITLLFCMLNTLASAQLVEDSIYSPPGISYSYLRQRTDMVTAPTGDIWISYSFIGVLHHDGTGWTNITMASTANQLPSDQVHQLWRDGSGALWMANKLSLTRMDSNGFKNYFFSSPYEISINPITDLTETQGKIFLSTKQGLHVLDTLTSIWQSYTTQNSPLLNDTINSLCAQPSGNVWISTQNGYALYSQNTLTVFPAAVSGLPVDQILSMVVTANDTLVAGGNNTLYRKNSTMWLDMDSIAFGYPIASMWCDSVSFGDLDWDGVHYKFLTNMVANAAGDILMIRGNGNDAAIFMVDLNKKIKYAWAYNDTPFRTLAGFYKTDSVVIAGGVTATHLRLFETSVLGNYSTCVDVPPYFPPFEIDFTIPPSYKGGDHEYLEGNKIRSGVLNLGDWAWDAVSQDQEYNVPRGSTTHSVFASALWFGGFDGTGKLYTAAMLYRQNSSYDFQPGPLDTLGYISNTTKADFNHIWVTRKSDIDEFRYQYAMGNVQNGSYPVSSYILDWPAYYSNPAYPQRLAPYVDVNGDQMYNPMDGDYPDIKGDQMSWCVFNDNMTKTETNSDPMFLEVHSSAYVSNCSNSPDALGRLLSYTTFYHFDVYNRNSEGYDSCYFGIWTDFDLGNAGDDFVGCNLSANSFFAYNGDSLDEANGGYGLCTPTQNVSFLKGPEAPINDGSDNDHNGLVDELNEEIGLSGFLYYLNMNAVPNGNPQNGDDYYEYMTGSWADANLLTYGGDGRGGSAGGTTVPTKFMFPDTSDLNFSTPWTMQTAGYTPNDMQGVGSIGPFSIQPGEAKSFDVAFITGPNDLIQNHDLVRKLRAAFRDGTLSNLHSSLPAIQGQAQITSSGGSVNYLLPYQNVGAQYIWTITNGLILSGQGTNAITVSWGPSGTGEVVVEVLEPSNPCGMHQKLPVIIGSQGFGQIANESTTRIYPNPTQHQLQIETPDNRISTYALRSTTGQLIEQKSYTGICDVSTLAPGMYFIELRDVKGVVLVRKMFLKQ